jgi:hypothetical protein
VRPSAHHASQLHLLRAASRAAAAALLLAAAAAPGAMREAPPAAHTGGFGEPTCHACHFQATPNSGPGSLTLSGLPAEWRPGHVYDITLTLHDPDLAVAGFQLAARLLDGTQAGSLEVPEGEVGRVRVTMWQAVQYAGQTYDGAVPVAPGTARWNLRWAAPAVAAGSVTFHAAANAANDDDSPLGDLVYTSATTIPIAAPKR